MNKIKYLTHVDAWIIVSLLTAALVTEFSTLPSHIDPAECEEQPTRQLSHHPYRLLASAGSNDQGFYCWRVRPDQAELCLRLRRCVKDSKAKQS